MIIAQDKARLWSKTLAALDSMLIAVQFSLRWTTFQPPTSLGMTRLEHETGKLSRQKWMLMKRPSLFYLHKVTQPWKETSRILLRLFSRHSAERLSRKVNLHLLTLLMRSLFTMSPSASDSNFVFFIKTYFGWLISFRAIDGLSLGMGRVNQGEVEEKKIVMKCIKGGQVEGELILRSDRNWRWFINCAAHVPVEISERRWRWLFY